MCAPGSAGRQQYPAAQRECAATGWVADTTTLETGGLSMIRTIYSSICGALIFIAALIPAAILILDKAGI